jgi:hypothetical protein
MMETWSIIKKTLEHCFCAVVTCALFAFSEYLVGVIYPSGALRWWIDQIEFILVALVATGLAVMFVSSLSRIIWDSLTATWKDVSNGKTQIILA